MNFRRLDHREEVEPGATSSARTWSEVEEELIMVCEIEQWEKAKEMI
jgi:uncharacterized cupin superfamily protein